MSEYQEYPLAIVPSMAHTPVDMDRYNPYDDTKEVPKEEPRSPSPKVVKPGRLSALRSIYFGISGMLGFGERFSLLFFFIFGGALFSFCLARVLMMAPSNVETKTVPGEWYWYRQPLFKRCIFIHIYLNIIAGIFAIFQFIPMIRRRKIILHRINGYFVLSTLLPAVITGSIVARRSFGGELNTQSAFYTLGFLIVFAAFMGLSNVRRTRKHRKWMLRTVAYTASAITGRIITIATRTIISVSAPYFAVWSCDEVAFVLNSTAAAASEFPACAGSSDPKHTYVLARASIYGDRLNFGSAQRVSFGVGLWMAILIHVVAIEIYIRGTESYQWPSKTLGATHQQSDEGLNPA